MMKNKKRRTKDENLKIVSRPSSEEIEEDLGHDPTKKWKRFFVEDAVSGNVKSYIDEKLSKSDDLGE